MVFELKNPLFRAVFGVKTKKTSFFCEFFLVFVCQFKK